MAGTLIYNNPDLSLLDLKSWQFSQLPIDQTLAHTTFSFSPDGRWFASTTLRQVSADGYDLVAFPIQLFSTSGERLETIVHTEQIIGGLCSTCVLERIADSYWITDELIYINFIQGEPTLISGFILFYPQVLNPFTGELQVALTDNLPERVNSFEFSYSPDLTKALYFIVAKPIGTGFRLVFWDVLQQSAIWILPKDPGYLNQIRWSPDGSMVAFSDGPGLGYQHLYLISADGARVQMIGDGAYPPCSDGFFFEWSPDSRYLAIDNGYREFLIFDVLENRYVIRCQQKENETPIRAITWSPDSQAVAFGLDLGPLRVLDITTSEVFDLLPSGNPVGWSMEFPAYWP
jgi:WD40 repeat protein